MKQVKLTIKISMKSTYPISNRRYARFSAILKTLSSSLLPIDTIIAVTLCFFVFSNVLSYRDAGGRTWTQEFDADGRRTSLTADDGIVRTWEYSAGGQVRAATVAGDAASFEYNALGQVTKATDATGRGASYQYDVFGKKTSAASGSLRTTYTYDASTQQLASVTAPGGTTVLSRDDFGRVNALTDPGGKRTAYEYDDLDRVTTTTYPDGKTEVFDYHDNLGRLMPDVQAHTDRAGRVANLNYDGAGRLVRRDFPDVGKTASYSYNGAGQVTSEAYAGSSAARVFDGRGRLTSVAQDGSLVSMDYENDDQIKHKSHGNYVLTYQYDAHRYLTGVDAPDGSAGLGYDAKGRLRRLDLPNGVARTFTHDGAGRTASMSQLVNGSTEQFGYGYDDAGRVTGIVMGDGALSFDYDGAGRLANETRTGTGAYALEYGYDANGNRTSHRTYSMVGQWWKTRRWRWRRDWHMVMQEWRGWR